MAARTDAYVDTAAFIAFADASNTHHALFRHLFAAPPPLVTSSLVIAEGHGWFLRRFDVSRALQFLAMIQSLRPLRVAAVGTAELRAGTALIRRFSDQALTLADAVGLHLMTAGRLASCWSTDRHMTLTGVPLVIHRH